MPSFNYDKAFAEAGVYRVAEFEAHNGETGNYKAEFEDIFDPEGPHQALASKIGADLAKKLRPYKPELVIPVPDGANELGRLVARALKIEVILLEWQDKEKRILKYADQHKRIVVGWATRVALIDDVRRTDSSAIQVIDFAELRNKQVVRGVALDRSDPALESSLDFPVEAVLSKFMPMRVEE